MEELTAAGALGLLKSGFDLVTGMRSSTNQAELNDNAIRLQQVIQSLFANLSDEQARVSTLNDKLKDLENELIRLKDFSADMKRYKLTAVENGGIVYALKESMHHGEPPHYLCTNCYQAMQKRILNCIEGRNKWFEFTCPSCKAAIPTQYRNATAPEYAPESP